MKRNECVNIQTHVEIELSYNKLYNSFTRGDVVNKVEKL